VPVVWPAARRVPLLEMVRHENGPPPPPPSLRRMLLTARLAASLPTWEESGLGSQTAPKHRLGCHCSKESSRKQPAVRKMVTLLSLSTWGLPRPY